MFNSKKIQKMLQQQELLDAKINSLAHGQKSLSEDFEVHFKRLRQSIYTSVEEFSSELQSQMHELKKDNESIKKKLKYEDSTTIELMREESETIKKQNGIINENIARMRNSLQIDFDLVKDQIAELKNQIGTPKIKEISQPLGLAEAMKVPMPTWTMRSGSAEYQSSPIQDKMKLEVEEVFADPIYPTESVNTKNRRKERKAVDDREDFFINVKLPEGVTNYLHNRSASKSMSRTCRNVFERGGKLVFAPLSYEITKNFVASKNKITTIQVSKNTYLAIRQIAEELVMTMTQVASNFVATMDSTEATEIGLKYSAFNSKELQTKTSAPRRGVGRPKKK
jgi:hypothetical protein